MSNEFALIETSIDDSTYDHAFNLKVGKSTHVTYKVCLMEENTPVVISRLVGEDHDGVLTIGCGTIKRVRDLVKSVTTHNDRVHHFGLKYHQAASSTSIGKYRLCLAVCLFMSSDEASRCEGEEQFKYRQKHGENPPFSGRWEGGPV